MANKLLLIPKSDLPTIETNLLVNRDILVYKWRGVIIIASVKETLQFIEQYRLLLHLSFGLPLLSSLYVLVLVNHRIPVTKEDKL